MVRSIFDSNGIPSKKTYAETSSRANVNIMMRFRVIKLVGIFSLFVTAVFLYTFNKFVPSTSSYFTKLFQERSTKENHLSTRNQIQLIQANEQLIIFITSAPFTQAEDYPYVKHGCLSW